MKEIRKYTGTCECGETHDHQVEIRIAPTARISDDVRVTCCGQSLPLSVVERKITRPFDRLRSLFAPADPASSTQQRSLDSVRDQLLRARGGRPWGV